MTIDELLSSTIVELTALSLPLLDWLVLPPSALASFFSRPRTSSPNSTCSFGHLVIWLVGV